MGRGAALAAALFGALGVLAIPAGVVAAQYFAGITLLQTLYVSVPAAAFLGLVALSAARRARYARARSVFQGRGRVVRLGRFLAWSGLYAAVTGGVALAIYGVLRAAH